MGKVNSNSGLGRRRSRRTPPQDGGQRLTFRLQASWENVPERVFLSPLYFTSLISLSESEFIGTIVKEVLKLLQTLTSNSQLKEKGQTCSSKRNSKTSPNAQVSPPKAEIPSSNYVAPQFIASGYGPTPVQGSHISIQFSQTASPHNALRYGVRPVQEPYNKVVPPNQALGYTGVGPSFRYDIHEIKGKGETSSMANNTKKPNNKSSKSKVEFNGWVPSRKM